MRYATEVTGPFRIVLKGRPRLELTAATACGGGTFIGETPTGAEPFYEVHFTALDGDFFMVPQRDIEAVFVAETGEEVEFGNPYMDGHPRPLDL